MLAKSIKNPNHDTWILTNNYAISLAWYLYIFTKLYNKTWYFEQKLDNNDNSNYIYADIAPKFKIHKVKDEASVLFKWVILLFFLHSID